MPYLFALKNDESAPVRLYALHRLQSATLLNDVERRRAANFDLDQAIASGHADFGSGERIALELRVRGYLATVLETCPLNVEQIWEPEPEGSEFKARVRASVPSTGQLLRWLLGAGSNVEVVAPSELRQLVAVQAAKTAAFYGQAADASDLARPLATEAT
ncbi:WYL domain-containing protein [Thiorhodococcus fuscus]|uniref:WYL domain-containing protein n=1 Tax=Thiorhodococcus fuscus TaxID=527200 RepID=A0ABW4YE32_9GAMM